VSLEADGRRCIFVSGTASIDEEGASTHPGDFEAQVRHTLEVGEALLEEAGAELKDVRQATAFVKHALDAPAFGRIASRTGLAGVPTVGTVADICRDELLFELDATATVETR
jgi:enamine deaminase RidA (YjgF/YER057c/UK114 family)